MKNLLLLSLFFAMSILAIAQPTRSGNENDEIIYGEDLTNDIASLSKMSHGSFNSVSLAVFVPGDKELYGGKIKAIRVPICYTSLPYSNISVWIKKKLNDTSCLVSQELSDIKLEDWNRIDLNEPIDIPSEGVYVGLSYDCNEIYYFFRYNGGNSWIKAGNYDWSQFSYGSFPIAVYVSEIDAKENNAAISLPVSNVITEASSSNTAKIFVTNYSKNELNSLKLTADNGEGKISKTFNLEAEGRSLAAGYGATVELSMAYTAPSTYSTKNRVTFTVEEVNGQPNSGDRGVAVLSIMTPKGGKERTVLVEENTGTGCGYCVYGFVDMGVMKERHGDRFAGIALHQFSSNDPMYLNPNNYARLNMTSAPSCKVNRAEEIHPREMYNLLESYLETPPLVDIKATAEWTNNGTAINITSEIESMINDLNVEIAYVLTADGLTKMSAAWAQSNYLASRDPYLMFTGDPIADFYRGGKYATNPVLGLVFNDVAISSSYKNSQTEVAAISGLNVGDKKSNNYTLTLQTTQELKELIDLEKTHIVVIVTTKDGLTANALKIPVTLNSSGIQDSQLENKKVVKAYTIDGRETSEMVKGANIIIMSDGTAKKVIVK